MENNGVKNNDMKSNYWEGEKSLRSLRDRVVVKLDETEETTKAGLYLPETTRYGEKAQKKIRTGVIIDIGPEVNLVKVGDRVVFDKYGGMCPKFWDKFVSMTEEDLLATITDDNITEPSTNGVGAQPSTHTVAEPAFA